MGTVTYRVPESTCPGCGHVLDAATGNQGPPEPGCFTVCICCGDILQFDAELHAQPATKQALRDLPRPILAMLLRMAMEVIKQRMAN